MTKQTFNFNEWVENNKFWIGGLLLVLVLVSGGYLLYRENHGKEDMAQKLDMVTNRLADLEKTKETSNSETVQTAAAPAGTSSKTEEQKPVEPKVLGASEVAETASPSKVDGKININTATAEQLDSLPGIGPAYAKAIIEYRNSHGGFKTIEEIQNVKGIGPKTFAKFKDQITVD